MASAMASISALASESASTPEEAACLAAQAACEYWILYLQELESQTPPASEEVLESARNESERLSWESELACSEEDSTEFRQVPAVRAHPAAAVKLLNFAADRYELHDFDIRKPHPTVDAINNCRQRSTRIATQVQLLLPIDVNQYLIESL